MDTMPGEVQIKLTQSEASRRRAWGALQDLRAVLVHADIAEIPSVKRPPRFEEEGRALVCGLEQTLRKIELVVEELIAAIEAARPYMLKERTDGFPQVHLRLNRALSAANALLPLLRK